MKIRQIIKLPKYKEFSYKPIYYDKRKEALEEKIQLAKTRKEAIKKGEYKPNFKGKFKNNYASDITKKQKKAANIRFFVLIIFFSVLAYIIIQKSNVLGQMFDVLFSK